MLDLLLHVLRRRAEGPILQTERVFYLFIVMHTFRHYLHYIAHCERRSIRDNVADMTANMSDISAYNIRMRENTKKSANAEPEMYMLKE